MVAVYHVVIETDRNPDKERYPGDFGGDNNSDWFSAATSGKDIFLPLEGWKKAQRATALAEIKRAGSFSGVKGSGSRTRATSFSQQLSGIAGGATGSSSSGSRRRSSISGDPRPVDPATHIARTRKDLGGPKPGSEEYYNIHTSRDYRFGRVEVSGMDKEDIDMTEHPSETSEASYGSGQSPAAGGKTVMALKSTFMGYGVVRLYRDLDEGDDQSVDTDDGTVVAILAVPGYMSTSDLLEYLGEDTRKNSSHIRLVSSNGTPNRYMVLIKFREVKFATEFYLEYNGKVFNSMEAETCHVVYVKSVQFRSHIHRSDEDIPYLIQDPFTRVGVGVETGTGVASSSSSFPPKSQIQPPLSSTQELPTCPVCLDRMDATITGLLTIICQHTFHCQCLQKWGDSSCPVCRHTNADSYGTYIEEGTNTTSHTLSSKCYVCEAGSNLWACLICGHVGCGRYDKAHAYDHYVATGHCFSMDITTQRVWDYASDGYVHRLIQNQSDGKLVELPSGSSSSATDVNKKDMEKDLSLQYTYLLTSQLESQRDYYENLIAATEERAKQENESLHSRIDNIAQEIDRQSQSDALSSLEDKLESTKQQFLQLKKNYIEEKVLSEKIMNKISQLTKENEEKDKTINDLNDQIRDLMFFLDAKERLANADEDIQQGTATVAPSTSKKKSKHKSKK